MALKFVPERVQVSGEGSVTTRRSKSFDKSVKDAHVVLTGFKLQFDKSDSPTKLMEVSVLLDHFAGNDVHYRVVSELQDNKTGRDKHFGQVDVMIIAELADQPAPVPSSPPA